MSVTIFSISACRHCLAAKATLKSWEIHFEDINVSSVSPSVFKKVTDVTKSLTVPQIFINGHFIGGNTELQKIGQSSFLKRLDNLKIQSLPVTPEELEAIETPQSLSVSCELDADAQTIEKLKSANKLKNISLGWFKTVSHAISHSELQEFLQVEHNLIDNIEIEETISRLLDKNLLVEVSENRGREFAVYQLHQLANSNALNANITPVSCDINSDDSDAIANLIRAKNSAMYEKFLSINGDSVDYTGMRSSVEYEEYKKFTALLQQINVEKMTENEKIAFFCNIYNSLMIHGLIEKSLPSGLLGKLQYFKKTSYIIDKYNFSLDDIEHGILRGNSRGPAYLTKLFDKNDPRYTLALPKPEPMIHFALNCGAQSCPPIKLYTAKNIRNELKQATMSFFDDPGNFKLDVDNNTIILSKILDWYKADFGKTKKQVLEWISMNMNQAGENKEKLDKIIVSGKFKIKYFDYNWTSNEKK